MSAYERGSLFIAWAGRCARGDACIKWVCWCRAANDVKLVRHLALRILCRMIVSKSQNYQSVVTSALTQGLEYTQDP